MYTGFHLLRNHMCASYQLQEAIHKEEAAEVMFVSTISLMCMYVTQASVRFWNLILEHFKYGLTPFLFRKQRYVKK